MPILEKFTQDIQNNKKAENPQLLVQHIIQWTNGEPELTKAICQLVIQSNEPIKANEEERRINHLVQTYFIENWQEQDEALAVRKVYNSIISSDHKADLLILYKKILEELEISFNSSLKQKELIDTGLVIVQQGKLKPANQIYKSVFNLNWVDQTLSSLLSDLLEQKESQTTLKQQKAFNQRQLLIYGASPIILLIIASSIYFLFSKSSEELTQQDGNFNRQVVSKSSALCYQKKPCDKKFKDVPNVPQGNFPYGGATTFALLRSDDVVNAINKAHPNFTLLYKHSNNKNPGSGTGIQQLLEGNLSFSHSSRAIKPEEHKEAELRGFKLDTVPVAHDAIAIYVNPSLPIETLTLAELRKIFTGEITNWQQLGIRKNLKITPFGRNLKAGGTVDFFKKEILMGDDFGNVVEEVENTQESVNKVFKTPGGISYASAPLIINQDSYVKTVALRNNNSAASIYPLQGKVVNKKYPLYRRLFVIIKKPIDGSSDLDQQAGEAYVKLILSDEGQKWVERKGFVPVRIVN